MSLISRGIQLGQAVKNVQRLRQIISVFAKHGFADVVERINLSKFLPTRLGGHVSEHNDASTPERMRLAFEELGPTFVKLGQLLSGRPDLLSENFIEEFKRLQDNVLPLDFSLLQTTLESELAKPLDSVFLMFDQKPIAAGSIGQVHQAVLKTGEQVVVKIQRPGIERVIDNDISLLSFIAGLLERYIPETRIISPKVVVDEFLRTLSFELDFRVEANNMEKMAHNLSALSDVVIPKVYRQFSSKRVLVLEKFDGIAMNDIKAMDEAGIDRKAIVNLGARAFFKTIMIDGLFHGDLHGGNLFVLPGNRLGLIDFGIVGRLSEKSRDMLANMVMSLVTEDFENLCFQYAEMGSANGALDFDAFHRDVRNTLAPYMGMTLKELNAGKILIDATKIATRYQIKVPGDWMIVFKAIVSIEGMGRNLDPDFDLMSIGQELVGDIVKNQYSMQRLSKDGMWVAKNLSSLLQEAPRQIRWAMRKFATNDFALEVKVPEMEELRAQMDRGSRRTASVILTVGLFIASSISLNQAAGHRIGDYPVIAVLFFAGGSFFLIKHILKLF